MVELPVDLRLPEDSGVIALIEDDGRFAGWTTEAVQALVGGDNAGFPEGTRPSTRVMFKRTAVRTHLPLQAADVTFGLWAARLMDRPARIRRWLRLRRLTRRGLQKMQTVAALTRYLDASQLPNPSADVIDFLGSKEALYQAEFEASLRDLNRFLVALGTSGHELAIGPIVPADIPAKVPVIVEQAGRTSSAGRVGWTELHSIHFRLPDITRRLNPDEVVRDAVELFDAVQASNESLLDFLDLWRQAEVYDAGGSYTQAILHLGVAMEVLIATIVREASARRGHDASPILGQEGPGLRNVVVDHLSKYIGESITHADLADLGHPFGWWWTAGYLLRNRVAHEGYRATGGDVEEAAMAARHAVRWLGEALSHEADTADLGERLSWLVRPVPGAEEI